MKIKRTFHVKHCFRHESLRIQLLSRSLLILAVLLLLIGAIQYYFMKDLIYENKASSLHSQIKFFPPQAVKPWEDQLEDRFDDPPRIFMPEASIAFIDPEGNFKIISAGNDNHTPPQLSQAVYKAKINRVEEKTLHPENIEQQPDQRKADYWIVEAGGTEQLVVLKEVFTYPGKFQGLVQISTPTAHMKELLLRQLLTFAGLALLALLAGLLVYLPVIRRTLVPLSRMVDTAEQIDAGNLGRRFPTRQGQAELDRLAESCNGMLERLEESFIAERETQEQMRRFIADASHELRTPLTSIHGFLEVLLRGAANQPDQLDRALKSMYSESQRLNKLVHDLLLLSKLDRSASIELREGFLDELFAEMEAQLCILAGQRELRFSIEPEVKCSYDSDKVKQVVLNIFQNAVQHTDPEKGIIQISLKRENNGGLISIQDNGPGISKKHLPHIFDRFYRSDTSRTRKYGGAGLGLAISKSIVEAHNGSICVSSQESKGSLFHVWLPG